MNRQNAKSNTILQKLIVNLFLNKTTIIQRDFLRIKYFFRKFKKKSIFACISFVFVIYLLA